MQPDIRHVTIVSYVAITIGLVSILVCAVFSTVIVDEVNTITYVLNADVGAFLVGEKPAV
jgi:hypothetical protein